MHKRTAKADKKSQSGRLRIVAGKWRSRLLHIAEVPGLRPTSERIRETVFNWLAPQIAGSRCLDLFAGTGALGLEALSRGAAKAVFVEKSSEAAATLESSIKLLGADGAKLRHTDAYKFLDNEDNDKFDIVFLDPPFADENLGDLCRLLAGSSKLAPDAWIYIEEDRSAPAIELPDSWQVLKTKNAGNVRYSLIRSASNG